MRIESERAGKSARAFLRYSLSRASLSSIERFESLFFLHISLSLARSENNGLALCPFHLFRSCSRRLGTDCRGAQRLDSRARPCLSARTSVCTHDALHMVLLLLPLLFLLTPRYNNACAFVSAMKAVYAYTHIGVAYIYARRDAVLRVCESKNYRCFASILR